MPLAINTNRDANRMNVLLAMHNKDMSRVSASMASGVRINSAADNPAGLIVSEQFRAQIVGTQQAIANSEQAVSMIQTAESALDEISTLLKKARQLAIHATNEAVNDSSQLQADQTELDNVIESVSRISDTTRFGTKKILDGSLSAASSNNQAVKSFKAGGDYIEYLKLGTITRGFHTLSITQAATQTKTTVAIGSASDIFTGGDLATAVGNDVIQKSFTISINGNQLTISSGLTKNGFLQQLAALGQQVGFTVAFATMATGASAGSGNFILTANRYGDAATFDIQFVSGASTQ